MKKSISLVLLFVLLINTLSSSLVIPHVLAETVQTSAIESVVFETEGEKLSLDEASGKGAVVVKWTTASMGSTDPITETMMIPDRISVSNQSGELIDEQTQAVIGEYKVEANQLSLLFNADIVDTYKGSILIEAVVEEDTVRDHVYGDKGVESTESAQEDQLEDNETVETEETTEIAEPSDMKITSFTTEAEITDHFYIETTVKKDGEVLIDGTEIIVEQPFSNTVLELTYDFELANGHSYGEGSFYTIQVPSMFTIPQVPESDSSELKRADGTVFGEFYTSGNDIVMVFNDTITQESNIQGDITLEAAFDDGYDGPAEGEPIVFPFGENDTVEFPISFKPDENGLDKQGIGNRGYNTETITWTVDVNKNLQQMSDVVLTDQTSTGDHSFIEDSFKIYELTMNADGSIEEPLTDVTDTVLNNDFNLILDASEDASEKRFELNMGDINKGYRIVYDTTVNDRVGTEYKNNVTLKSDSQDVLTTDATVAVTRGKPLEKEATDYDDVGQIIDWEVKYNYDEKDISQDRAILTDTFQDNNQQLIDGSMEVYKVSIDPDTGVEIGEELYENYTLTRTGSGYEIQFNEAIHEPFKIKYQTETIDRVSEDGTVTNTIKDDFGNESEGSQDIGQGILIKNNTGANYKNKTTDWSITINRDEEVMTDVSVTDKLPAGFTFDKESLNINGYEGEKTVTYSDTNDEMTIEFSDVVTERVEITYTTDIDFDVAGREESYSNSAVAEWIPEGESTTVTKTGSATFVPDGYTKNNGFKFGRYNVQEKEITWTIGVNYNNETLNEVIVTDPILGNQNFDKTSVKIYEMVLTGGANGFEKGTDVTNNFTITDLANSLGTNAAFSVQLGDIQTGYVIEFTTDFKNEVVEELYKNTATIESDNHEDTVLDASVSPRYGGEFTTKAGQQNSDNGRIVNWTVNINRSQSKLDDVVITDTPSINQTIIQDTLKIYGTTATETNIVKDPETILEEGSDYTVSFTENENGQESYEINFLSSIEKAYILEYDTYILYEGDGNITNDLSISGEQVAEGEGDANVNQAIDFRSISGSISGEVGSLTIKKIDAEDNETTLEGAEFHLYDETGDVLIKTGTTDSNGELRFVNLLFGEYQLKEVTPPEGYTVNPAVGDTQNVTVGSGSVDNNRIIEVENYKIKPDIRLTKIDGTTNEALANVVFTLYDADNNQVGNEHVTDANGEIYLEDLTPGDYYFKETTVKEHYQENTTEYHFNIKDNHTILDIERDAITVENELIPGSAFMQKIDADTVSDDKGLSGAKFRIVSTDDGINFSKTVTSADNGLIETGDLRPGNYTIEEISAPYGFTLSDREPIQFNIALSQVNPIEILAEPFENNVKTTAIELTKRDAKSNQLLTGAEFELSYQSGDYHDSSKPFKPIIGETDENGALRFGDLKPGIYELVETKAPSGYILNQTPIEIEVTLDDVELGQVVRKTVKNHPFAAIRLKKVDSETDTSLSEAEFELIDSSDQVVSGYEKLMTDHNGMIELTGLVAGDYRLREIAAPEGYMIQTGGYTSEVFTVNDAVTETEIIELNDVGNNIVKGSVKLVKVDGETKDPLPGVEFRLEAVSLVNSGTYEATTHTTDSNGEISVEGLRPGTYRFTEVAPLDGYQAHVGEINFDINFPHKEQLVELEVSNYKLVSIPVRKVWNDNNQSENRPGVITVELLQNNLSTGETLELTAEQNWKGAFEGLDAIDSNSDFYEYTVREVVPGEGYLLQSVTGNQTDGFDLTNLRVGKTSVSGKKIWLDDESNDRPETITVHLLQNGEELTSQEVSVATEWSYSFNELEAFDKNGVAYNYTVEETPILGYEARYEETEEGYDITNVRVGTTEVRGEKTWLDGESSDRPESITVNLLRNGEQIDQQVVTSDDNWTYNFTDLDTYDSQGVRYTYTITEEAVEGYATTINGYDLENLRVGALTINGEKIWQDEDSTDRPESIKVNLLQNDVVIQTLEVTAEDGWIYQFEDIPEFNEVGVRYDYRVTEHGVPGYRTEIDGYNVINTRTDITSVTVNKAWLDDEAIDRPDDITIHLLRNGERVDQVELTSDLDWTYTFEDLAAYDDLGQAYVYTVEEDPVPGYETIINGYDITNVRVGTIDVSGKKTWLDGDTTDRPESINVNLLRNGEQISQQVVTSDDNWTYNFTDLDAYDNQGVRYTYTIAEDTVEGYQSEVDGFDLTNLRVGETSVSGKKIWLDDESNDRPETITVYLLQNGEELTSQQVSDATEWSYSFNELEAFDENGVAYNYTVEEAPVAGYEVSYEETDEGYDITNVRVGTIDVSGKKTWLDDESSDRPESITVNLLRNGEQIDQQVVTSDDNWTYSFSDLDKYDNQGVLYVYTITENPVAGYATTINGYDIENLRVGTLTINGEKIWQDDNPTDRPESIKVNLLQNDVVIQTLEVTAEDGWIYQFEDIPEFNEVGERYEYRVTEDDVSGYHTEIDGYNVINTRIGMTSVTVHKTWLNDSPFDRPESITVHLLRNGERFDTAQITAGMDWTYTFKGLAAYDDFGKAYIYTIAEEPVSGYETVIDGYNITNEKIAVSTPEEPEGSDEETLPNTATTLFNYLLMGAVFMVIGWISLMASRKKTNR